MFWQKFTNHYLTALHIKTHFKVFCTIFMPHVDLYVKNYDFFCSLSIKNMYDDVRNSLKHAVCYKNKLNKIKTCF